MSDAIQKINAQPNACAANYLLAAKCGEALDVEKSPVDFEVFIRSVACWYIQIIFVRQNETCRYQQIYGTRYVLRYGLARKMLEDKKAWLQQTM